jgi:azurin
MSSDEPVHNVGEIHAPAEAREHPLGKVLYVLEQVSHSVYEYDTGRGRMLGPAPRIVDPQGNTKVLPGYPTVVGSEPPQDAQVVGHTLAVAGGEGGDIVLVPMAADGELGTPKHVALGPTPLVSPDQSTASPAPTDADERTGKAIIRNLLDLPGGLVLAASWQRKYQASVLYVVDPNRGAVLRHFVLIGGGVENAMTMQGGDLVVATSFGGLYTFDPTTFALKYKQNVTKGMTGIAADGANTLLSYTGSAHIDSVDRTTGKSAAFADGKTKTGGVLVQAGPTDYWWALPDDGVIRQLNGSGATVADFHSCQYITSVLRDGADIWATCVANGGELAHLRAGNPSSNALQPLPIFPIVVTGG